MSVEKTLKHCKLSKYAYYKKLGKRKRAGRKPSTLTQKIDDVGRLTEINEEIVIQMIIHHLLLPETSYGYRAMTVALQHEGLLINHKKVYRLMYKYQLLGDRRPKAARAYVRYRRVNPERPLQVLEMDIKFQWITTYQRYGFILSVIDCFTRKVLYWSVAYSIKQAQIKQAWQHIIVHYLQPAGLLERQLTVELRNDNDTRFAAKKVQEYFKENHIDQVFTHPYTPQENGHIESFHAILGRSLQIREYPTIHELQEHLEHFYHIYNNVRLHGSILHLCPQAFITLWENNMVSLQPDKKLKHRYKISLKIPHYQIKPDGELRSISQETKESISRKYRINKTLDA